jgi:hypothetical protein
MVPMLYFASKEDKNKYNTKIEQIVFFRFSFVLHLGLFSVIKAWSRVKPECKLTLLAPRQIITWLSVYAARFESVGHLYRLVPLSLFVSSFSILMDVSVTL